jgi:flavin reductase (DIM6/NTAB) family NADH-FMN oxidoreductase RutF
MSSIFWLGWRCMLGLDASSKTTENMIRTGECVVNLPSADCVAAVNRLARTTGSSPVPPRKVMRGYVHERNKFEIAGLTPVASETVSPPRALECPVQLEGVVMAKHGLAEEDNVLRGKTLTFETRIQRVHLDKTILMDGDPDQVHESNLATNPESAYRSPDVDRARDVPALANVPTPAA